MKIGRVFTLAGLLIAIFCFLVYKLMDIQLISTEEYGPEQVNLLQKSVEQRASEITLTTGRGMFIDKNEQPLNHYVAKDIVIFPFVQAIDLSSSLRTAFTNVQSNWLQLVKEKDSPIYLSDITEKPLDAQLFDLVNKEQIPGIIVVERTFENQNKLATHLLGLVRQNSEEFSKRYGNNESNQIEPQPIGISGLEKTFDSFLVSEDSDKKLQYHVDAKGNPLLGMNLRYKGNDDTFYPLKVQTTIDAAIQQQAEDIVDQHQLQKGGVIVLDVDTREVRAMVSRPSINESNPYHEDSVKNQMITAQYPGSIFKIVVAAAAMEHATDKLHQQFDCDKNLYGDAPASRSLGLLTFEESFAQSCNFTFGQLAQDLIKKEETMLEEYAKKLGVLGPVGWQGDVFHFNDFRQLPEEEAGKIWGNEQDRYVNRAIIQTAIGQKEVKLSPLAVANMVATIANNGIKREVKVVDKLLYSNNTTMENFTDQTNLDNRIDKETAVQLKELMEEVVTSGTGQRFHPLSVAGKSGTAETGKKDQLNHWFVGYFPIDDPQYAMVVVDLEQSSSDAKNYDIFHDMVEQLLDKES
ncbi:peptidoglycan D,D-transpeptidase FtsI family protein [Aquibacillus sediminis]|uniref:peptidoglycan D,D-transpeptidase FtsI family protein n=1 Tax=Aquibacillus sediminis TaxID=2574734 RepID=UPI001487510C|nr:penicillin-binding protein 2 [Aquibacillus sediminis]